MIKFSISALYPALGILLYLGWAKGRTDRQINKMQEAAFNSPGAEAPVPPDVVLGGVIVLVSHFVFARRLLKLRLWQAILSLLLGSIAGVGIFLSQRKGRGS